MAHDPIVGVVIREDDAAIDALLMQGIGRRSPPDEAPLLLGWPPRTHQQDDLTVATDHFARLSDSPLRDAWRDEARDFTPWLFDNIDYLSEALGLKLEATDSEITVDNFSADIIATDTRTGDRILIENQLEGSDHRHLGQILTYLAGIDAKCVIWIAREFQEAHLSALRWLNDNTPEHFAFFAVRVRVVRIGDSPFAPVFEVVEKPNSWERQLGKRANVAESELTKLRQSFWNRYLQRHSGVFAATRDSNVWVPMLSDGLVVLSMYVASKTSGMFLRGPRGTDGEHLAPLMARQGGAGQRGLDEGQPMTRRGASGRVDDGHLPSRTKRPAAGLRAH